jgi:hypothetical protein
VFEYGTTGDFSFGISGMFIREIRSIETGDVQKMKIQDGLFEPIVSRGSFPYRREFSIPSPKPILLCKEEDTWKSQKL